MVFEQFAGVFAPIPTPFSPKDRGINFDFIRRHIEFLIEKGIDGIVVLGTNGEFPSLSIEERKNVISWVMKFKSNLKVIAQTGSCSFVETVSLCDYAKELGVDGVLIAAPYYFKNISENGLVEYYFEIMNRVHHPIFLYNMPQNTHVPVTHAVIDELLSYPHLLGLKDSGGKWETLKSYIESYRRLHIFVGSDELLMSAFELGAGGSITASANTVPELVLNLYRAVQYHGDAGIWQSRLSAFRRLIAQYPIQAATKYILSLRGFEESAVRAPLTNLTEAQKHALERELEIQGFRFVNGDLMFDN
ncbi:MAG: dihydrodipicolinate synthase family protein [candidate division KSB1 bacterium]|nr:dihydrodipicolinate synthase family protein [candidate division KSB1 bacterium]MDZ7401971.1 dihydrodipicolinate synthase family protein [candidate division KSB1 bacterium]